MRIVGGKWAGRDLASPSGRVRPTTEELRAAWLDALQPTLKDTRCVDLFAGSGALGLEAISRGARTCDFVENNPSAMHALKANVAALRARNQVRIFDRDAIPFVEHINQVAYDIGFVDPPYGSRKLDRLIERWLAQPFCRILCIEHAPDYALTLDGERIVRGESAVTIVQGPLAS
jgi:16S rRNA (guanine966-N2)-methyltransferase